MLFFYFFLSKKAILNDYQRHLEIKIHDHKNVLLFPALATAIHSLNGGWQNPHSHRRPVFLQEREFSRTDTVVRPRAMNISSLVCAMVWEGVLQDVFVAEPGRFL